MSNEQDELVKLARGSAAEAEVRAAALRDVGIECRVVGEHLTAGLGTVVPGSVELWVAQTSERKARAVLKDHGRLREHGDHGRPAHGHPTSDAKPDRSRGPVHGAPPHRPLPS